jgi:tetratricopeptide (TPR) repeat protein
MKRPWLFILFLAVTTWSLAACLEPWFQGWAGNRASSGNLLQIALGDGRKVFARHAFVKADAYFHNGYYPSIFDNAKESQGAHINEVAGLSEQAETESDFMGKSRDWIDAFSRNFYPSIHSHLGESDCEHDHDHEGACDHDHQHDHAGEEAPTERAERELLPWLRLSAELDPARIETYVIGAYWLRNKLKRVNEAEAFLREGLRANPRDPSLLFELGRILHEERQDNTRARSVWEQALRNLNEQEKEAAEPNRFLRIQILGNLGRLEEQSGNTAQAIEYLQKLELISPHVEAIRRWIEDLRKAESP